MSRFNFSNSYEDGVNRDLSQQEREAKAYYNELSQYEAKTQERLDIDQRDDDINGVTKENQQKALLTLNPSLAWRADNVNRQNLSNAKSNARAQNYSAKRGNKKGKKFISKDHGNSDQYLVLAGSSNGIGKAPRTDSYCLSDFKNVYNGYIIKDSVLYDTYLDQIRKFEKQNTVLDWLRSEVFMYQEICADSMLFSDVLLSDKAKRRHNNQWVDGNNECRRLIKSTCCIPTYNCIFNVVFYCEHIFNAYDVKLRKTTSSYYAQFIALQIIRISVGAVSTHKFVEYFKIKAKLKIIESYFLAEAGADPKSGSLVRICQLLLIVEQCWIQLSKQRTDVYGMSGLKSSNSFISGYAPNVLEQRRILLCLFRLIMHKVSSTTDIKISSNDIAEVINVFWGTVSLTKNHSFFNSQTYTAMTEGKLDAIYRFVNNVAGLTGKFMLCKISSSSIYAMLKDPSWLPKFTTKETHNTILRTGSVMSSSLFNYFVVDGTIKTMLYDLMPGFDIKILEFDDYDSMLMEIAVRHVDDGPTVFRDDLVFNVSPTYLSNTYRYITDTASVNYNNYISDKTDFIEYEKEREKHAKNAAEKKRLDEERMKILREELRKLSPTPTFIPKSMFDVDWTDDSIDNVSMHTGIKHWKF